MRKEIEVAGKLINLEANGATPHIFKRIFDADSMMIFPKILDAFVNGGLSLDELQEVANTQESMESEEGKQLLLEHGAELFPILSKLVESGMLDFSEKIAFVMAMQAKKSTTECLRLNEEDFINWLVEFPSNAFMFASGEVLGIYLANNKSSIKPKNPDAPQ